jgi:hypothetical protein
MSNRWATAAMTRLRTHLRRLAPALLALMLPASAQPRLEITTAHDSAAENATRTQLIRLLGAYDVSHWIFTTSVLVDETAIPHSHPVLTLHTRHARQDLQLLSTFVHEEIHWYLEAKRAETRLAVDDLERLYPSVPAGGREGAGNTASTYLHLVVNYLELQAMKRIVGPVKARAVFDFWAADHYTWIYRTVLADEARIGDIVAARGLDL